MGISIYFIRVDINMMGKDLICGLFLSGEVVTLGGAQRQTQVLGEREEQ
jgi:hypothetical protein